MNTEIDSLSLKIDVSAIGKDKIESIKTLAGALTELNQALTPKKTALYSRLAFLKIDSSINASTGANVKALADGMKALNRAIKGADYTKLWELKNPINIFNANSLTSEELDNKIKEIKKVMQAQQEATRLEQQNEAKNNKEEKKKEEKRKKKLKSDTKVPKVPKVDDDDEVTESGKHRPQHYEKASAITKLFRRIKLIAFIKAIRGALNAMIKGFQSALQQLATFSSGFNDTMSSLTTSFEKISGSLILIVEPLLEVVKPAVEELTSFMIDASNAISKANAQTKGLAEYSKINASYAKNYADSMKKSNLFSFDTFETLNGEDSMFETGSVDDEVDTEGIVELIQSLQELGALLGRTLRLSLPGVGEILKAIAPILDMVIQISDAITESTMPIIQLVLEALGMLAEPIKSAMDEFKPIVDLLNNTLVPTLKNLFTSILKPIANLIGKLPIEGIVSLITNILKPVLEIIDSLITEITTILTPIFDFIGSILSPILDWVNEALLGISDIIGGLLGDLSEFFKTFKYIFEIVGAVFKGDFGKAEEGVKKLVEQIVKSVPNMFMGIIRTIVKVVEWIINRVIEFINVIIANPFIQKIVGFFGGDWQGITWRANWSENIPSFANGGLVGEVWQMNEYGTPEMLFNSNGNSNTAVITQAQLAQAFEQAIYNTGLLDTISEGKTVYIDGKSIAQSKSFKNEINRTNPNLGLK